MPKKNDKMIVEDAIREGEIVVTAGEQVDIILLQTAPAKQPVNKKIILHDKAVARVFCGLFDSIDLTVIGSLQGNQSVFENHIIYFGHAKQHIKMNLISEHHGKKTMSRTLCRGVALESTQAYFAGSINIHPTGSEADGILEHDGLLLSKKARIDSLPGLEIGTNDVKASHASATHYIRPEQLFYLQSRGLEITEAKQMIVAGFLEETLATVRNDAILNAVHKQIANKQKLIS